MKKPFVSIVVASYNRKYIINESIQSILSQNYPEDSFDNMKLFSEKNNFVFPYVYDETQSVGREYNAVCTPDFFGFNANNELQYRGRLEESKMEIIPNAKKELLEAMIQVSETGSGPNDQIPSIGCSIKWKE